MIQICSFAKLLVNNITVVLPENLMGMLAKDDVNGTYGAKVPLQNIMHFIMGPERQAFCLLKILT